MQGEGIVDGKKTILNEAVVDCSVLLLLGVAMEITDSKKYVVQFAVM